MKGHAKSWIAYSSRENGFSFTIKAPVIFCASYEQITNVP